MLSNKEDLNKTDEKPHFPLSFAQQRLWFLEQLNPQKSIYNISKSVLLIGPLNLEALTTGIESIIDRHENLRTSITTHMGKATQVINPKVDFDIDYQDLSNMPKKDRTLLIKKRLRLEASSSFNLSKSPLFRCTLLRLSHNEHILSLTFHHIITDAWSMDLFFSELSEFYNASIEKRLPKLPELPVQYIDFAVWQREFFTSQVIKKQLDYWKDSLTGILDISSLPSDYVRPKEASYRGTSYRYVVSPNILHTILQLAHEYNLTLFTILITVYQILLHRFSNQDSIVTGTPVLNRHYPKVENLIGFFVNTLAMRLDCEGNPKFIDLLLKNKTNVLAANENQDVPFEQIVDYLKIERDLSRHPIFQTWFVLQNKADSLLTFRNLEVEEVEVDEYTSKFDLALWVKETTHNLELNFEYSTDLFQEETIKQFAISFEIMLKAIGKNPKARIEKIPLVSDEFKADIIHWNKEVKLPHTLIHELIEAQAAKVPDNTALKLESQTLTYHQLMRDVNQLARFLQSYIIPGQSRVILALPRGFDAIIALLATIKVGGTYIPVDSNWPKARLEYILEDSKAGVVLTYKQSSSLYLSQPQPRLVLALDELRAQWQALDDSPVLVPLDPEQLAYIIYTSGSTGQPKGVLVPHRGLVNLALAQSQIFEINEKSRVLQFAPLSFDASVSEWSTTLLQGGVYVS